MGNWKIENGLQSQGLVGMFPSRLFLQVARNKKLLKPTKHE